MRHLNKYVKVFPIFTAVEWDLYTHSDPDKCDEAARELNETLSRLVFLGTSRKAISIAMQELMESYAEVGALDSEPLRFLEQILDEIFGAQHGTG